jgi:hypothetical protein
MRLLGQSSVVTGSGDNEIVMRMIAMGEDVMTR